ncbi:TPA: glycosyltransferase family 2 protein [bacterium]|nr:glycosyltransferase family 2 protein [bacterium]
MDLKVLAIVVPCYNEEEVLPSSNEQLISVLNNLIEANKISKDSYILYVDDGSKDRTWSIISSLYEKSSLVKGLKLSRNKGHQNALLAGLEYAKDHADVSISIDADLQDDINVISKMVDYYLEGHDIVYGVRSDRKKDSFFKRFTAQAFYKLMNALGTNTVYNHADFRLMSNRALEGLFKYNEVNVFLRGIVPTIGFKSEIVYYERKERQAGVTKYPLKKMLSFAFEGITSFSIKPLTLILRTGIFISFMSVMTFIILLVMDLMHYQNVDILVYLGILICFLLGLNLVGMGIVGQYVGKNYVETKARPRYIVEEIKD